MELPNIHFQDFPIEFKEINPSDFPNFEVGEKIIISPNEERYINEALQDNIQLEEKNTVVINAAVGQGKTHSIIDIVHRYYQEEDYMIFIASPFVSLVEQYYNKVLQKGIPQEQIYRYELIGNDFNRDAWNSKIQIITANSLLGDSGEDSLINSDAKRNYLNHLVNKCEQNNRKVVFIFDEIHDAIRNFKEEYIFNLWKWRNVIHKNFILSATYNEASKIVIEILAELTDNKIQIIESERVRFPEKQSDLYLHYNPANSYKFDNDDIANIVESLIKKGKQIDILSFSKRLADDICKKTDSGIGKLLIEAFGEIQNCTSDLIVNERMYRETPKNRYSADKCNVGTNFKTGVSIEKENHAFIIIMPPSGRQSNFHKNNYGIFSDGINSVIQALARQRIKGEIHIILPPPNNFNFESLPFQDGIQITKFKETYEITKNYKSTKTTDYISLAQQNDILKYFYNNPLLIEVQDEIDYISSLNRENKIKLDYPTFNQFKLNKGEQYLSTYHNFFGKDLSSYITYCAFTNQFVNCNLVFINTKPVLFFTLGQIQWKLNKFSEEYLQNKFPAENILNKSYFEYNESFISQVTDMYVYIDFKSDIFLNYKILLKDRTQDTKQEISSFSNKEFERQFIAFLQRKFHPQNRTFNNRFVNNGFYLDAEYMRGDYFRSCIAHALRLKNNLDNHSTETVDLIRAYSLMNKYRGRMILSKQNVIISKKSIEVLSNSPYEYFICADDYQDFNFMIQTLIDKDIFISREIFDFKNSFIRNENDTIEKQINTFYTYLKADMFETYQKKVDNAQLKGNFAVITSTNPIPEPNQVLDFISPADILIPYEAMTQVHIVDGKVVFISPN